MQLFSQKYRVEGKNELLNRGLIITVISTVVNDSEKSQTDIVANCSRYTNKLSADLESQVHKEVYLAEFKVRVTEIFTSILSVKYLNIYTVLDIVEKNNESDSKSKFCKSSVKDTVVDRKNISAYEYRNKNMRKSNLDILSISILYLEDSSVQLKSGEILE